VLALESPFDRLLLQHLLRLDEIARHAAAPSKDVSQRADRSIIRNFRIDGTGRTLPDTGPPLPSSGEVELDVVVVPGLVEGGFSETEWSEVVVSWEEHYWVGPLMCVRNRELGDKSISTSQLLRILHTLPVTQRAAVAHALLHRVSDSSELPMLLAAIDGETRPLRANDGVLSNVSELRRRFAARLELCRRVGWLVCWSAECAEGYYELDLRNPDERQVVRVLVELAAVEAGKNWRGSTLDHMAFELPDSWREALPTHGLVTLYYHSTQPDTDLRHKLSADVCLACEPRPGTVSDDDATSDGELDVSVLEAVHQSPQKTVRPFRVSTHTPRKLGA